MRLGMPRTAGGKPAGTRGHPGLGGLPEGPRVLGRSQSKGGSDGTRAAGSGHLEELPHDFRTAVYLADVEGFSYLEIADIMHSPVGTVMSRLHRARGQLRTMLREQAAERGIVPNPRYSAGS
jgi:hypothetical protein